MSSVTIYGESKCQRIYKVKTGMGSVFSYWPREHIQAIKIITTCPVNKLNKTRELLGSLRVTSKCVSKHVDYVIIHEKQKY